ncbi:AMP-dependent synthetase/ligase [Clostridium sp. WILCCON 0269]|uniref:AMP-dependent synthetase/ligase n=1 Tax=Candidatus Clostridium eludens TaxID=3381663 RepID=A0ABW8SG83_9CLOT
MKNYPLYETEDIKDLKELVENCAKKYGDKVAFKYRKGNKELEKTYVEFFEDVKYLGTVFTKRNIKDSHIAVIGENSYEWIVTYFAALATGNVIVPFDKDLNPREILWLLQEVDCKVFVFSAAYQKAAEEVEKNMKAPFMSIVMEDSSSKFIIFNNLIKEGKEAISLGNSEFSNIKINKEQLAAIHYTSGTTGISKGVMLTHKNLMSNVIGGAKNIEPYNPSVLILPIHHTFGMTAGVIGMLYTGTCICINSSMKRIARDLKKYKPKSLFLVPLYIESLYNTIWRTAKSNNKEKTLRSICRISDALLCVGIDLRKYFFKEVLESFGGELKLMVCGGAHIDPKYIKGFRSFGVNVLNGYGITECSPIVAVNKNNYYKDGSVGTVLDGCEVKIDNPNEDGEGEILVRGDSVMKGYYKDEGLTEKAFCDNWFKTGDIGRLDKEGFLYITGRSKNVIILNNGKNIYPEELEMHIMNIPFVKEVLVYSEKDEKNNQMCIVAEVYVDNELIKDKNPQDIEKELSEKIDEINRRLPYYKNIGKYKIREEEFKKTSSKKIIRDGRN